MGYMKMYQGSFKDHDLLQDGCTWRRCWIAAKELHLDGLGLLLMSLGGYKAGLELILTRTILWLSRNLNLNYHSRDFGKQQGFWNKVT